MSSNNDNDNDNDSNSPWMDCYRGMDMPLNPKINMDEDVEEVTRKIAPTMIMPSLGPMPTMPMNTGMISALTSTSPSAPAPTINTSPMMKMKFQFQRQEKGNSCNGNVNSNKSSPFSWKLPSVPVLPEFHPLEKTAAFVPNCNSMPSEVTSRISDILRERSIEAQYENGKAKVKCKTVEGVDFRIRLYRGRGRYNHGIIVEVQRRFGTSLVFHSDTKAILDAAQGKVPPPPAPPMTSRINLPEVTDDDDDENEHENENDEEYQGCTGTRTTDHAALAMVAKIMKNPGFDSQYLGLQTLSPLVDSERLSLSTARAVAASLFQQESVVGKKVFDYITNNNKGSTTTTTTTARGVFDDDDDDDDDSSMILRNMCLNILANAIRAYGKVPKFLTEPLRPALLQDLYDAEKHPNTALLSAKCMEYFVHHHQGDHHDTDITELSKAFEVAHKAGEARHANLMHQAKKCMNIIIIR